MDGADLVPGDIGLLEAGDKVRADLRAIEARGLAAQEAILTGKSVPFARWLSLLILLASALLLASGYFVGQHGFSEMFMAVVGVAIAAIPEVAS